jgi:radical SAM family RiPP maturation amino acid epimerase
MVALSNISVIPSEDSDLPPVFQQLQQRIHEAFDKKPECFEPVLKAKNPSPALVRRLSHVKRFLELWTADPDIRARTAADAQATIDSLGLNLIAEEIRFLYDEPYCLERVRTKGWKAPLIVQQYRLWCIEKTLYRERSRIQLGTPALARHRAWRDRQIQRSKGQLGQSHAINIVHAPFAVELSDGCSVGCWFCGVSAEKRKRDFEWNEENAALWSGVVTALKDTIGPGARQGFCYWATDPLDNPDYEKFCTEFARITGRFPQTTTAQAHKHIERVRQLLGHSKSLGCEINRFSILSLPILKKIHDAFTPEELLWTELITQNMEATSMQSNSGRARNSSRLEKKPPGLKNCPLRGKKPPAPSPASPGFS